MSAEETFDPEAHKSDEQVAIEQEKVDEERETSFQLQKDAGDVGPTKSAEATAEEVAAAVGTPDPTDTENGAEEAEVAAIEEATAAAETKSARSARKSRTSGRGASTAVADEEQARKRARKSAASATTTTTSEGAAGASEADANVRLDRLRQALFRFLDLIEHRATHSSFAKALPHIDEESAEALRQQFVGQLKEAIIDESEKLIESNELEAKLASLHRLAQEAEARYQAGYPEGADEIKDVWRKNLDLETAISARAIPDQERRVNELRAELELVRKQNQSIHAKLMDTKAACDAIQGDARDSLDALESVSVIYRKCSCRGSKLTFARALLSNGGIFRACKGHQGARSDTRHAEAALANHGRSLARPRRTRLISRNSTVQHSLSPGRALH